MLNDKDYARLTLEMTKHRIEEFTRAGMEAGGNLRQAFLQIRNQGEQMQERLVQLAMARGWYEPAAPADPQDIQRVMQAVGVGVPTVRI